MMRSALRSAMAVAWRPAASSSLRAPDVARPSRILQQCRWNATVPPSDGGVGPQELGRIVPKYELTFTCKKCSNRSSHHVSKQAYHNGTVLITCPGCRNRHLIADHLKTFSDDRITLEDILAKDGVKIKKGIKVQETGDIEILPDEEPSKA
ncbi:hypothetical protein G7K_3846-t1 [Saitoella complicata NRRL Y-17804]|uniref:DNL-type domain-containing protein n=2 Tax=Saitoella complicata (strain BCRC 22490 / CBS 7301 / JCM 7358 / NBRC 10748 / NRRL Y-17804) TaxID=698492 RepID=A0A0E9NJW7_SAICN|nr:hypothetical protein G7K_3846-t1 [Saitoella complicata NRRL Y-17804]